MTLDRVLSHCREVDLQEVRGIYFLIRRGRVVYVGQGANIHARIALHMQSRNFDRALWMPVPSDDLDAYEGAFTRYFNPRWCRHTPANESRDDEVLSRFGLRVRRRSRDAFVGRRRAHLKRAFATAKQARAR